MAKKTRSLEETTLDVFEAVKRALIHRGYVRHKRRPAPPEPKPKKLRDVTTSSHDVLFKADTIFPFTLFPDTVILDREKLSFITRYFFFVAKLSHIPVVDILSVEADIGPFFGSVHTSSRYFITSPHSVNFLWRRDAIALQRLLQGYIIAKEQEIDTGNIDKDKLISLLNELGKEPETAK